MASNNEAVGFPTPIAPIYNDACTSDAQMTSHTNASSSNHQPDTSPSFSPSSLHALLLLSDSALPLSAFAFSSGLESYLAHHPRRLFPTCSPSSHVSSPPSSSSLQTSYSDNLARFLPFLKQSITSLTRASLPFVLAAHHQPGRLVYWDDVCDASTLCNVGRRQSVEQGRALSAVWMRGLRGLEGEEVDVVGEDDGADPVTQQDADGSAKQTRRSEEAAVIEARRALIELDRRLKRPRGTLGPSTTTGSEPDVHGHLAPLFGAVARATGMQRRDAAYVFLLNHAKSVISAAVRAGVCGPFKQQELLASRQIRVLLATSVDEGERVFETYGVEGAGQTVALLDIWQGRHELLYSRVFNS